MDNKNNDFGNNHQNHNYRQDVDNTLNAAGSKLAQGVGVPKSLADKAVKTNGGPLSPTNLPGNRAISNVARNKLANNPNVQKLMDAKNRGSQHQMINSNKSINSGNKKDNQKNEKSNVDQVGEEVGKKAASVGLQAAGVPKPLADIVGDKIGGKLFEKSKKKIIIGAVIAGLGCAANGFIIICIIAVLMSPMLLIGEALAAVGDWFSSLGHWLTGDGWCADAASCAQNAEEKFYEEVNNLYENYRGKNKEKNFELDTDVIVAAALYDDYGDETVDDSDEEKEEDYNADDSYEKEKKKYKAAVKRLSPLADALGSGGTNNYIGYKRYLKKTYLPRYYDEILYEDEKEKSYQLEMIATEIISYSQNPDAIRALASRTSNFNTCQSVKLQDENGNVSELSLEQYILGVVKAEGSVLTLEAQKALAIAARTYVLKKTSYCNNPIENSSKAQNYTEIDPTNDAEFIANLADVERLIMTIDGQVFLSEYDSYYTEAETKENGTGNYHCDDDYCYVNYCKLGASDGCLAINEVKGALENKKSFAGGHGRGMSQWGAHYLAKYESKGYEDILRYFYDNNIEISEMTYVDEEGLAVDPDTGFLMRVERAQRDNEFFYNIESDSGAAGTLEGECAWFGTARAKEILASINSPVKWTYNGNGGTYCDDGNYDRDKFAISRDYREPRQGAVVSWKDGSYGHVAIIEKVNDNGTVDISEAAINWGGVLPKYGKSREAWTKAGLNNSKGRRENCEENQSGCFRLSTNVSLETVNNRWGQRFQCYIYLDEPYE